MQPTGPGGHKRAVLRGRHRATAKFRARQWRGFFTATAPPEALVRTAPPELASTGRGARRFWLLAAIVSGMSGLAGYWLWPDGTVQNGRAQLVAPLREVPVREVPAQLVRSVSVAPVAPAPRQPRRIIKTDPAATAVRSGATRAPAVKSAAVPTSRALTAEPDRMRLAPGAAQLKRRLAAVSQRLAELKVWEWRARRLAEKMAELRGLINLVDDQQAHYVTGRLIRDARSLSGDMLKLQAGQKPKQKAGQNIAIRAGDPVVSGGALIGVIARALPVGAHNVTARIKPLHASDMRLHVSVGPDRLPALMIGDGTATPRLVILTETTALRAGMTIWTAAATQVPKGVRVGQVGHAPEGWVVRLAGRPGAAEYASVLMMRQRADRAPTDELASRTDRPFDQ